MPLAILRNWTCFTLHSAYGMVWSNHEVLSLKGNISNSSEGRYLQSPLCGRSISLLELLEAVPSALNTWCKYYCKVVLLNCGGLLCSIGVSCAYLFRWHTWYSMCLDRLIYWWITSFMFVKNSASIISKKKHLILASWTS